MSESRESLNHRAYHYGLFIVPISLTSANLIYVMWLIASTDTLQSRPGRQHGDLSYFFFDILSFGAANNVNLVDNVSTSISLAFLNNNAQSELF